MSSDQTDASPGTVGSGIEVAALRKLVYNLADNPDPDEVNVVQAAEIAVNRFNEMDERMAALEGATGINIENAEYKNLSRAAKLKEIREKLKSKAEQNTNSKAAMDYNDVIWLFDGHPSPGHASELVTKAGDSPGFNFQETEDRNNRVIVDLEKLPG